MRVGGMKGRRGAPNGEAVGVDAEMPEEIAEAA